MTRLISLLVAFLLAQSAFGQAPDTLWTRTYGGNFGDEGIEVVKSPNGYLLVGVTFSFGAGGSDVLAIWIDEQGDSLRSRTYGTSGYDRCFGVANAFGGGYAITGYFGDPWDLFVLRISEEGDSLWWRGFGGGFLEAGYDIESTVDSGFIVAGFSGSFHNGAAAMYMLKIDSAGSMQWQRDFIRANGGEAHDVELLDDSGYLLTGSDGNGDAWWVKTDSSGALVWNNWFDTGCSEQINRTTKFANGFTASACQSGCGDMMIIMVYPFGIREWVKFMNWGGYESAIGIQRTNVDGVVVCGRRGATGTSDVFLLGMSRNGDSLWTRTVGGNDFDAPSSMITTPDGGYLVLGRSESFTAAYDDFYLVRFEPYAENRLNLLFPLGSEQLTILSSDTIRWAGVGFEGGVSIALNRYYPVGPWEVITNSTENDGEYEWFVTDPLSDSCRIRICAVQDTFCDISDGNFSIVSSQGYLALVKSSAPNSPVLNWNAGVTECPASQYEWFRLKNFGSEAVVVFQPLEPPSGEFSRSTVCGSFFALAPNQMSACSLQLSFTPNADGTYLDTLRVQTDAVNGLGGYVKIPLSGEQISTPASPEVVILPQGSSARLMWDPIAESIGECPVTVTHYLVFYSPTEEGPYYYHGLTSDTTYVHTGVIAYAPAMFYTVTPMTGAIPSLLRDLEPGEMTREDVMEKVENRKLKIEK